MKSRNSASAREGARRPSFFATLALGVALALLTFGLSAPAAFAAPAAPVISGPTAVQFISHPSGFRGALSWQPVDTATEYQVYDADSEALISTVTTPTYMVYGLQGTMYRRYVVAVDSVGDTSTPSNTLEIQTVAPVAPASPPSFTVLPNSIFDLQTSAPASASVPVEVPYSLAQVSGDPASLRLFHYTDGSWVDITTSVDTTNSVVTGVTSGFSVLAVMEPAAIPTFTITFVSNGGSPVEAQVVDAGSLVATPVPDPARIGYTFAGWYSDATLTAPWDFTADTVAADMTLYAKWTVNTYPVAFDSNGGSAVDTQIVEMGSLVATPVPDPVRAGYTFAGWYSDPALNTPWDFAADTVTTDVTLYAKWTVNSYQVSFDSAGGTAVDTQTLDFGSLVATPVTDPVRLGYTFAGWFSDSALTTPWDFAADRVGASDLTLYAKWTVNSYQVTFDSAGGSAVPTQQVDFGALVAIPTTPTWDGSHIFGGWYRAGTTTAWDFSADHMGAEDMSLVATWTPGYKITGSSGAHGTLSLTGSKYVPKGSSLTVTITPSPGYGVSTVKVDGVSKGAVRSYTFRNVTRGHTISATFRRVTSTTLSASAKTISKGRTVTLYARLKSSTGTFRNTYIRFEVKLPGSKRYILLKNVKVSSTGRAHLHYEVLNRGTRYHRVRFLGNPTFLPAPVKSGLALRVR